MFETLRAVEIEHEQEVAALENEDFVFVVEEGYDFVAA